jgi:hypothetical protein
MKNKHCSWCDNSFETSISYQIYCSAECREAATKEKIAERYRAQRTKRRGRNPRKCKSCGSTLSMYNDEPTCQRCSSNPDDVAKALKEIKGIANGKIEL